MIERSAIWVTWERQQRNHSLSALLGVPLYEIVSDKKGGLRYAESLVKTIQLIASKKPEIVFCQNPSIVLSFFSVLLRRLFSYVVIVDEHNAGLFPLEGQNRLLNLLARYIVRKANGVIVTNVVLADKCKEWGGEPLIIEDPLPEFNSQNQGDRSEKIGHGNAPFELVFICTWASDEPYLNVIQAAKGFSEEKLTLRITGKHDNKIAEDSLPESVKLTGFLSKDDYVETLKNSNGVLVLTTRQNCLNCGAYEAVSLLKPGILSDTPALRRYFSTGFLFTDNSPEDIAKSIELLMHNHEAYKTDIADLRLLCEANDRSNQHKVIRFLNSLP
jgi:glycosyltransferase involved in cell wall biosynthesis